jgi:hypothetical protein
MKIMVNSEDRHADERITFKPEDSPTLPELPSREYVLEADGWQPFGDVW